MLMGMFFLFVLFGMFSSCTSEDENLAALNEEKEYVIKAASSKALLYGYKYIDVCFF